ncbi:MAG TPA: HDOD domain-containing protein, partial [Accumulibacter sp.]|nr:HDOD domain-containing protein [Accumulibacter sp.]
MTKLQGDDYAKAVNANDTPSRQYLAEMRSLPFTHLDASVVLCKVWKLPEMLARPISFHHMPAKPASRDDA